MGRREKEEADSIPTILCSTSRAIPRYTMVHMRWMNTLRDIATRCSLSLY